MFTAHALNSGIFAIGSSVSIVSTLAAASTKCIGMKTAGLVFVEMFTRRAIEPRRDETRTTSPVFSANCAAWIYQCTSMNGSGNSASNCELRVIEPPCQCSSNRPVVRINGYSSSVDSTTGTCSSGKNRPRPDGKSSANKNGVPGCVSSGTGYCKPTRSILSYVIPLNIVATLAASRKISSGPA